MDPQLLDDPYIGLIHRLWINPKIVDWSTYCPKITLFIILFDGPNIHCFCGRISPQNSCSRKVLEEFQVWIHTLYTSWLWIHTLYTCWFWIHAHSTPVGRIFPYSKSVGFRYIHSRPVVHTHNLHQIQTIYISWFWIKLVVGTQPLHHLILHT